MKSNVFQDAIESSSKVFGRKADVRVVFEGSQAHTDGNMIVLPALPASAEVTVDQQDVIRGYRDHESAHVRCTDTSPKSMKRLKEMTQRSAGLGSLVQFCEDVRIEHAAVLTYPGTKHTLSATNIHGAKMMLSQIEQRGDPAVILTTLPKPLQFRLVLQQVGRSLIGVTSNGVFDKMSEIIKAHDPALHALATRYGKEMAALPTGYRNNALSESASKRGTTAAFDLAEEIYTAYGKHEEDNQPPAPPPQPAPAPAPAQQQAPDDTPPPPPGDQAPEDDAEPGDGEGSDGQGEAGDKEDGTQGSGDSESDDAGEGEGDNAGEGEGDDQADDSGSQGGDDSSDDEADDGSDGGGSDASDDDSSDAGDSSAGGGDTSGEQGDDAQQDDAGDAGNQGHSNGMDADIPDEFGVDDVRNQALQSVIGDINHGPDLGKGRTIQRGIFGVWTSRFSTKLPIIEAVLNCHDIVGKVRQMNETRLNNQADRRVLIMDAALTGKRAMIRRTLELELQARNDRKWESGFKSGRLQSVRLVQALQGRETVYQKRQDGKDMDTLLHISIDGSGSMTNNGYAAEAVTLAYALSEALERTGCDIIVEMWGSHPVYSSQTDESGYSKGEYEKAMRSFQDEYSKRRHTAGLAPKYVSFGVLTRGVLKSKRQRTTDPSVRRGFGMAMMALNSSTPSYHAVFSDLKDMSKENHAKKVYLHITDGDADEPIEGQLPSEIMKEAHTYAEAIGVHMIGVGIGGMKVSLLFKDSIEVRGADAYEPVIRKLAKLVAQEAGHAAHFKRSA